MTWAGESGPAQSGFYIFTDDGSPEELVGSPGEVIIWNAGFPAFESQASLTGVEPTSLNQIGDVDTSTTPPSPGQTLKWDGSNWTPSNDIGGSGDVTAAIPLEANRVVIGDDGSKGVKTSKVIISDQDESTFPGRVVVESGAFLLDINPAMNMVMASGSSSPDSPVVKIYQDVMSGEFLYMFNPNGNVALEFRQNGSGDGIFRIRENGGDPYFQVVDGQAIIRTFDAPAINPEPGYAMTIAAGNPGSGLLICAGDAEGDIALKIADQDKTFDILEVHTDNGQIVMGDTYANVLASSGVVYGIDNQNTGSAADFNTKNGGYRIDGNLLRINNLADVDTATSPPSASNSLVWNGTNWIPSGIAPATAADQPSVQARRTTAYSLTTSFVDINFDATDVENTIATVEHDNTNVDRVLIKQNGLYLVTYHFDLDQPPSSSTQDVEAQVRVNDTSVVNGSRARTTVFDDSSIVGSNFKNSIGKSFIANLSSGDFLSVQLRRVQIGGTGSFSTRTNGIFTVTRLSGQKGETGQTGAGSNVIVKDENTNVPNTPHSQLDFQGTGVTVADGGSGRAIVTIPGFTGTSSFKAEAGAGTIQTTSETFVLVPGMTLTPGAGTYFASFGMTANHNKSGQTVSTSIFSNGAQVPSTERTIGGQAGNLGNCMASTVVTISAGQAIEARWKISSNSGGGTGESPGPRSLILLKLS